MELSLDFIPKKVNHTRKIADIKDIFLKTEIEILLNNWCVQKLNEEYVFFKHFNSNRKGVIHQLILSGNEYDGVYELEIFGRNLKIKNIYDKELNDIVMKIETLGNYDLAKFDKRGYTYTVDKNIIGNENFNNEIQKYISQLSKIDIIEIFLNDKKKVKFDQNELGEIKFRNEFHKYLKNHLKNIKKINFSKKKKQYYISKLDLGEEEFKKELFRRNMVTPEEYELFTSQNKKQNSLLFNKLRKIEII